MNNEHPAARQDPYIEELANLLDVADMRSEEERKADIEWYLSTAYRKGLALDTPEETLEAAREATSPLKFINGTYVNTMRSVALTVLRNHPNYPQLCEVPVCLLPTDLLN